MISFTKIGSDGRDGTARYYAIIDYEYTVGQFVKSILNERMNEWGEITVKNDKGDVTWGDIVLDKESVGSCEYSYGKLKSRLKRAILEKNIVSIWCYGGYSFMDYIIIIDNK